eukprot:11037467-Alexandrium_andersonii.AAC.1
MASACDDLMLVALLAMTAPTPRRSGVIRRARMRMPQGSNKAVEPHGPPRASRTPPEPARGPEVP